jgi:hypothetical protein
MGHSPRPAGDQRELSGSSAGVEDRAYAGDRLRPGPGDAWDHRAKTFRYTIEKAVLGTHKGHDGRVYAHLLVGNGPGNYDATFVESEPFLILP